MKKLEIARGHLMTVKIIIECAACGGDIEARSEFRKPNAFEDKQTHVFVEPCQECMKKTVDRINGAKRSCKHERLNMDGICHSCGADCRGSH